MKNYKTYRGFQIYKLFPSGMYEFYSNKEGRFLKFDDIDEAKQAIDQEMAEQTN